MIGTQPTSSARALAVARTSSSGTYDSAYAQLFCGLALIGTSLIRLAGPG
jgi:hypothetical protein